MLDFFYNIDLFKIHANFRIKQRDSISTVETIILSTLFYIICFVVLIYNFFNAYIDNSPIMQQSEEIRNIDEFEIIDTSKLKFAFSMYHFKLPNFEFLKVKDERIFGIVEPITNTNFNLSLIPTFNAISYINSKFSEECIGIKNNINQLNSLSSNLYCNEYFVKNTTIGGSLFSNGMYIDQQFRVEINLCDLYDLNAEKYEDLINDYKNNDLIQRDFEQDPNNEKFDINNIMKSTFNLMLNKTALSKFYNSNLTNFQKYDENYSKCLSTKIEKNQFIVGIIASSDLLKPSINEGYYEFLQSKYKDFDVNNSKIIVNIKLKKIILNTDYSLFYSFGRKKTDILYEQEIFFDIKPKSKSDNIFTMEVAYELNDRILKVFRSYNKIDLILAQSFSIIELFHLALFYICSYISTNQLEYEIINKFYFTDLIQYNNHSRKQSGVKVEETIFNGLNLKDEKNNNEKTDPTKNENNLEVIPLEDNISKMSKSLQKNNDKRQNSKFDSHSININQSEEKQQYSNRNTNIEDQIGVEDIKKNNVNNQNINSYRNSFKNNNVIINNLLSNSKENNETLNSKHSKTVYGEFKGSIVREKNSKTDIDHKKKESYDSKENILSTEKAQELLHDKNIKSELINTNTNFNSNNSFRSFFNYKSGIGHIYKSVLFVFCKSYCKKDKYTNEDTSELIKFEKRDYNFIKAKLVNHIQSEIDIINLLSKQHQFSIMFDHFIYENYKRQYSSDSEICSDDFLNYYNTFSKNASLRNANYII